MPTSPSSGYVDTGWVSEGELRRLERYQLVIVDEVGYLPLEGQATNLLFALVSRRHGRGSIIDLQPRLR